LLALLCTRGGLFLDVIAILLALASGAVATNALQGTRARFASNR